MESILVQAQGPVRQHVAVRPQRRLLPQRLADVPLSQGLSAQGSFELGSEGWVGRLRQKDGIGLPQRDRWVCHAQRCDDSGHIEFGGGLEPEPGAMQGSVLEELLVHSLCQCKHQREREWLHHVDH